jgi:tetratricopeptide (TPR) repeat protein
MLIDERVQLARALAEKHGGCLTDVEAWWPLLRFSAGNPLTITVLIGQALRENLETKEQVTAFVARLRAGEEAFEDEESEGRSKSLGASLSYGFQRSFSQVEKKQLALLHLFHRYLNADTLFYICRSGNQTALPEIDGSVDGSGTALLKRAAEIGLLTAVGGAYYALHPVLPWFLKSFFDQYYRQDRGSNVADTMRPSAAEHAFAGVMGEFGEMCCSEFQKGHREFLGPVQMDEDNLHFARSLAIANGWWSALIGTMQGLLVLYDNTGRVALWSNLVDELRSVFEGAGSGGPILGRESGWAQMMSYRVRNARYQRNWNEAERLQRRLTDWRTRSGSDRHDENFIILRARDLENLANALLEQGKRECLNVYKDAMEMYSRVDPSKAAGCAYRIGNAFTDLPALRDLDKAEEWYLRSIQLARENDALGRSLPLGALGQVAFHRGTEALQAMRVEESFGHLMNSIERTKQALLILPSDYVEHRALLQNKLSACYSMLGSHQDALSYNRQAIAGFEACGMPFQAARARFLAAVILKRLHRYGDALEYARYAHSMLRSLTTLDPGAAEVLRATEKLLVELQQRT